MKTLMWCVTAISRLTRARERVTLAMPKSEAEKIRTNLLLKPYKMRDYTHPKVEIYQEDLFDNNQKALCRS